MKFRLFILGVLNFLDAFSTHMALKAGFAKELNPIARYAYNKSALTFYLFKLVGFVLASFILFLGIKASPPGAEKYFNWALTFLIFFYVAILVTHLYFWSMFYFFGFGY